MAQLAAQRLGLAVGLVAGVVLSLGTVAVLALVGNRDSKHHVSTRPVPRGRAIYTLRAGDVVRAPLASTECEASGEGGIPNLFCTRTKHGRYQIVFYSDAVLVFDLLDPHEQPMESKYAFKWFSRKVTKSK